MKKYNILNLYACLGGNRYKWDEVAKEKGIEKTRESSMSLALPL